MTLHHLLDTVELHAQQVRVQLAEGNMQTAYFHANELQDTAFMLKNLIFREQRNSGEVRK